jgi:hypothetical protein
MAYFHIFGIELNLSPRGVYVKSIEGIKQELSERVVEYRCT